MIILSLIGMIILSLVVGAGTSIAGSFRALLYGETGTLIVFGIRLPRIVLCIIAGSTLAICGAALQGLFKNPLCDPHILGVSSGAGLGAAIAIALGLGHIGFTLAPITLMAFVFGGISVLLVIMLARIRGRVSNISLLLAGIAVSAFMSAGILLVMRLNQDHMENIIFWTMGSLNSTGWGHVLWSFPFALVSIIGILCYTRELDMLSQGEESALHGGVNVAKTRTMLLIFTTLGTASVVSVTGVIGFVGLMMPHVVRMIFGPSHRSLLPLSALLGALFLLVMDTLARTIAMPQEIPVGILTALCGAPFFLYILRRRVGGQ